MQAKKIFLIAVGLLFMVGSLWVLAPVEAKGAEGIGERGKLLTAPKATPTANPEDGEKSMLEFIKKLQKDKKLSKEAEKGAYYTLEDFEKSEAKINYFFWYTYDISPKNFILRADVEWESASNTANWDNSGFGVVFHNTDDLYFYVVMVALDGNVEVWRMDMTKENYLNERWVSVAKKQHGKLPTPKGNAHLDLVVNQDRVYGYLDGKLVLSGYDNPMKSHPRYGEGGLGFTVISGTNTGFGTRVKMTNMDLWEIEE